MNSTVLADYLAALRSGVYRQGFDRLRDGDRFSALGVLADVLNGFQHPVQPEWVSHPKHGDCWQFWPSQYLNRTTNQNGCVGWSKAEIEPPVFVVSLPRRQWWSLSLELQYEIETINDRYGTTLPHVADAIEDFLRRQGATA